MLDPHALWIAIGSVGVKEVLFRYTYKVGKQFNSSSIDRAPNDTIF
jgi:divalent metal cation (Fe/Co/Zn/Cd) transporter